MSKKGTKAKTFFKISALILLIAIICAVLFAICYVFSLKEWRNFDPSYIPENDYSLTVYDADGSIAASLYSSENRSDVDIDKLPPHVINAFLAGEDARFYSHNGIDIVRIFGALLADIKSGEIKEGASTITQQLIKTLYLKNDKSVSRKISEALMAIKFEEQYTKDEILEMYLNTVYFGGGAYGIEAASNFYFGISANELSIDQAATLAATLKAPSTYAPHIDINKSKYRRDTIINNMKEYGFITEKERKNAVETPIKIVCDTDKDEYPYGFYLDMVLSESEEILGISSDELLSGGYKIYTSLDASLQKTAEEVFSDPSNFPADAADGEKVQSALIVLKNDTGNICAVIGGREHSAMRILNRATDTYRQPGSSIKPLMVYAPAIESAGYVTTSFILDEQESFNGYTPSNPGGNYNGWVTLREALSRSLNVPAIKVLYDIGVNRGMEYCSRVGIPFHEDDEGLTLGLGGFTKGVTPLQLARAYIPFATGGKYRTTSCINKIEDKEGKIVYENETKSYNVLSEETAFLITDILKTCATEGTARRINIEGMDIAAKTGTHTYSRSIYNKDAWVVAYNPEYTVCCWMGFDKTDENHVLEPGDTGGIYPTYIAKKIFESLYKDKAAPSFTIPENIVSVELDAIVLQEYHDVLLADANTPKAERITEYYTASTVPSEATDRFTVPPRPEGLYLSMDGGYPFVSFEAADSNALYIIYRECDGNKVILSELDGNGGTRYYTDSTVEMGKTYTYYVQAKTKYKAIYGKQLHSAPSSSVTYTHGSQMTQ